MTDERTKQTTIDEDMTPEERLQWLRDRGIQVETPEERKASSQAVAHSSSLDHNDDATSTTTTISYVLIPCDSSQPLQELSFRRPDYSNKSGGSGGDLLVEHLKKDESAFGGDKQSNANRGDVDVSLLLQDQAKTLLASSGQDIQVSDAALKQVAAEQSVETFSLVHPTPSNQYTGINMYLDEVGMLKRLPLNVRAKEYAARAGYNPPPTFYGNVYLGRTTYKSPGSGSVDGIVQNRSFGLPDTAMDAPWLQAATMQNLQHQMEVNRLTAAAGQQQQPSVPGDDGISKQEDGFAWTQTEEELEVTVSLPKDVTSCKQIKVQFRPKSLVIHAMTQEILSIRLFESVDVDSCTWTLETEHNDSSSSSSSDGNSTKKKRLVVSMEKVDAAFWPRIRD